MASNNLRILYNNIIDISGTSIYSEEPLPDALSAQNLKSDVKNKVWRTTHTGNNKLTVLCTACDIDTIVFAYTNFKPTTIAIVTILHSGGSYTTDTAYPSGYPISPYTPFGYWNASPSASNGFSYGGGVHGRIYLPQTLTGCTQVEITIYNDGTYVEASRLLIGKSWSPKYNTSYGLSTGTGDMSSHQRTESGNLITTRGPRFDKMSFDLKYMTMEDRTQMMKLLKGNGLPKPVFVSLFPEDEDLDKEQQHQLYGKLAQLNDISHPILDMYSTQIQLESI